MKTKIIHIKNSPPAGGSLNSLSLSLSLSLVSFYYHYCLGGVLGGNLVGVPGCGNALTSGKISIDPSGVVRSEVADPGIEMFFLRVPWRLGVVVPTTETSL
jgi:hypothetical protein